jgi:hypothetical protein
VLGELTGHAHAIHEAGASLYAAEGEKAVAWTFGMAAREYDPVIET